GLDAGRGGCRHRRALFQTGRGDDRKAVTPPPILPPMLRGRDREGAERESLMSVSLWTKQLLDAVMFREIWNAMKVTFTHMFHRPITFQYPREERTIPDTHRGALA